jgi:hypothetical protein
MVPGTEQSETPVPPKVDFETRGPKAQPGNRLYGVSEKCMRDKPRERGKNSTPKSIIHM